ncbi:MAG: permease, partial [Deltaproteobacteria bacterium]
HYGVSFFDALPQLEGGRGILDRTFFAIDYTLVLNVVFLGLSGLLWWLSTRKISNDRFKGMGDMASKGSFLERILTVLAYASYAWLGIGLLIHFFL